MTTVGQVYEYLDSLAPFSYQMDFDNSGFLIGEENQIVTKILVALDITLPVIEEAKQIGAQLIVSHHPIIFHPVKAVTDRDILGQKIRAMVQSNLSAICAHTNLDVAAGGVNDALAGTIGLIDVTILSKEKESDLFGLGRIGQLKNPLEPRKFVELIQERLHSKSLRVVLGERVVSRVAVGGGSCGEYLYDAVKLGCDAFITGDVKYDQFLDASAMGVTLIDAGHFPTENVICPVLQSSLSEHFPYVDVLLSKVHHETCVVLSEL